MSFIADVSVEMPLMSATHEALPEAEGVMADYHRKGDESGSSQYVLFVWMSGAEPADLEAAFEADETIEAYEFIAEADGRRLYRLRSISLSEDDFHLAVLLRDHGIALQEVTRDREGLHLRGQFPTRESLHSLKADVDAHGCWFRLNSVFSEDDAGLPASGLTARQLEVLRVAQSLGHFETPSEATLSEVADELDISPQAVSGHLRAAVRKLVARTLQSETPATRARS